MMPVFGQGRRQVHPSTSNRMKQRPGVEPLESRALMTANLTHFAASADYGGSIQQFVEGPNGTFWFVKEKGFAKYARTSNDLDLTTTVIGEITDKGKVSLSPLQDVARATVIPFPDGTTWIVAGNKNGLGGYFEEITANHQRKKFSIPVNTISTSPTVPKPSSDDLWYDIYVGPSATTSTPASDFEIVRVTPQGTETYPVPATLPGAVGTPSVNIDTDLFIRAPDRSLWFSEDLTINDFTPNEVDGHSFVRIDPTTGQIHEYTVPSNLLPGGITGNFTFSKDGSLYFQNEIDDAVGTIQIVKMSLSGQFSVVASYPTANSIDNLITGDPVTDSLGNIWFTDGEVDGTRSDQLNAVRMNANGTLDSFPIMVNNNLAQFSPLKLIPGANGSMLFVSNAETIGQISATGHVSYTWVDAVPNPNKSIPLLDSLFNSTPFSNDGQTPLISFSGTPLVDPDGNLWFVQTTDGLVTRYVLPGDRRK